LARRNLKSCLEADFLRKLHTTVLLKILSPFLGALKEKGFELPQDITKSIDYRLLAAILAEPSDKLNSLIEAIYLIANVGIDERFDELLEVAAKNSVDVSDLQVTAADLAARIYLVAPQDLEKMERANSFQRRRRFDSFVAREGAPTLQVNQLPKDMSAIETDLRAQFVKKKLGRKCTVTRKDCPGEIRFLIQRGEPYTRQPSCDDENSGATFYRPERTDFVIVDVINNELRVNAKGVTVVKLYREVFCQHLFGDKDRFVYADKYTLEPLKAKGKAALECSDIEGMKSVTLTELEYRWPGPFDHRDTSRATDVFRALSRRWNTIKCADFVTAKFTVKLTDEARPRFVKIIARNTTDASRGEEALIIEEWLRQRGFILIQSAKKDAKPDATVAGD